MNRKEILIDDLCSEIDYWRNKAINLEQEKEHYREQYLEVMKSSIDTSQKFIGGLLGLIVNKRIN
jgi:hypothetical protein